MSVMASEREGCIWHVMPERVRQAAEKDRQAYLAQARRAVQRSNSMEHRSSMRGSTDVPPDRYGGTRSYPAGEQGQNHNQGKLSNDNTPPKPQSKSPQQSQQRFYSEGHPTALVRSPSPSAANHRSKTKHTIQFRGPHWAQVLRNDRKRLEAAFKKDVKDASGLEPSAMERIEFTLTDVLSITFIARHTPGNPVPDLHILLQNWKFPATTALYPEDK